MRNYIKKMNLSFGLMLLSSVLLQADPVWAADFHSARTRALGGAGHAGPFMTDSVYLNPSFLAFQRNYALSGNYSRFTTAGQPRKEIWNAAIGDGTNPMVQAGLAYTHRLDAEMYHLALANKMTPTISVGLAAKGYHPRTEGIRDSKFDGTASVTWAVTPMIQAAAIVDNLFNQPAGHRLGNARTAILGTKFNIDQLLLIYLDPHWVQNPKAGEKNVGYQAGVEIPIFTDFFLRGGAFRSAQIPEQAKRGDGWGAGLGWIGPKMGFDYSYSRVKKPVAETQQTAGVTVFF